jgi:hypothetical protein
MKYKIYEYQIINKYVFKEDITGNFGTYSWENYTGDLNNGSGFYNSIGLGYNNAFYEVVDEGKLYIEDDRVIVIETTIISINPLPIDIISDIKNDVLSVFDIFTFCGYPDDSNGLDFTLIENVAFEVNLKMCHVNMFYKYVNMPKYGCFLFEKHYHDSVKHASNRIYQWFMHCKKMKITNIMCELMIPDLCRIAVDLL